MKPLHFNNDSLNSQTRDLSEHERYHPVISFSISLTITTFIILIIGFFYFISNFSFGGGETLSEIEMEHILLLYISILIFAVALFVTIFYLRTGKKYTALGILVLPILLVFSSSNYLLENNFNHTDFSKTIWMQSKQKPEKMAKTLVREKKLIGLTRTQVKDMLGEGLKEYGNTGTGYSRIEYWVSNNWTLTVLFQKDKVIESELMLPYYSLWSR